MVKKGSKAFFMKKKGWFAKAKTKLMKDDSRTAKRRVESTNKYLKKAPFSR